MKHFLIVIFTLLSSFVCFSQPKNLSKSDKEEIKYGIKQKLNSFYAYVSRMSRTDFDKRTREENFSVAKKIFYKYNERTVQISITSKPKLIPLSLDNYLRSFLNNKDQNRTIDVVLVGDIDLSLFKPINGGYECKVKYLQKFTSNRYTRDIELGMKTEQRIDFDNKELVVRIIPFTYRNPNYEIITGYDIYFGDITVESSIGYK